MVPLTDITLTNFNMWTVNGNTIINQCKNVYGTGYCAGQSPDPNPAPFTSMMTTANPPAAYTAYPDPAWGIKGTGYGVTIPIPVYTPAVFWAPASPNGVLQVKATTAAAAKISAPKSYATTTATTTSSTKGPTTSWTPKSKPTPKSTSSSSSSRFVATASKIHVKTKTV